MEKGCPNCGRMVDANCEKCPYCNYDFKDLNNIINKYERERLKQIEVPKYAGFIKRVVATGVDLFIWSVFFLMTMVIYVGSTSDSTYFFTNIEAILIKDINVHIILLLTLICYFLYCVFSQYSKKMGTIGERLFEIEVVLDNDTPLSLSKAIIRNLARIFNIITLGIGFIIIIFTKKKQSLSDIVSHTCVINRITNENYNEFRYSHPLLRFMAFVIDVAYIILLLWVYEFLKTSLLLPDSDVKNVVINILGILLIVYVIIYFPYMESKYGATFGKRIMDIKVVDMKGEKISFLKSIERLILMIFETLIPLSHILSFVTPRKQTLKDIMSKTIVINR